MRSIVFYLFAVILLASCNSGSNSINSELQSKNDSLERLVNNKDSALYSFINTFTEIENNLATIKAKENIITSVASDVENRQTREQKINEDINLIYSLMKENQEKVKALEKQLRSANIKNNDLQKTIVALQEKLSEKNAEIVQLRKQLLDMNLQIDELTYKIDTLNFNNEVNKAIIKAQDESLHTAYYIIGSEKELKEMNIINKKGSFIGLNKKINKNLDSKHFTKIDVRDKKTFEFGGVKKIKILTSHPDSSYTIYGEKPVDSLVIKDVDKFWNLSKYLVIAIN